MNVSSLNESKALTEGSDLWVIKNDPELTWWSQLDLASHYLFSKNFFRNKKNTPTELISIIDATRLDTIDHENYKNFILIGTENHFLNRWTLVWNNMTNEQLVDSILELSAQLKFSSVRFFSHSQALVKQLNTRPMASSISISYIEST